MKINFYNTICHLIIVRTRFLEKFDSWSWTWVDVVFMLIWCDMIQSLVFDPLIFSRLNAYTWFEEVEHMMFWLNIYAWFEEAEHVMLSKLIEHLRLIWGSEAHDVIKVDWMSTFDLKKQSTWCYQSWLNVYAWFEEAKHVMLSKLIECLRLIWRSGACDVIKVDWDQVIM